MRKPVLSALLCALAVAAASAEPIRLHPDNPHYFLFQDKPAVLVTSAEHYGAVLNLDFDYKTYLDTLQADSLNYTRIFTGTYVEKPGSFGIEKNTLAPLPERFLAPWARSAEPGYANGGNKFDLTRWNDAYFNRLKDFVAEAGRRGIAVEVTLFSSIYTEDNWALSPLNRKNNINDTADVDRLKVNTPDNGNLMGHQEQFVRKTVRELNGFDNVIFEIQNEPWADHSYMADVLNPNHPESGKEWQGRVDLPTDESLAWQERIASFLADEEKEMGKDVLLAQNYCNFRYPIRDVNPAVSILNFHYAWPDAALLNFGFDRVIAFDESGFAGSSDDVYRRQAWNFLLSGGSTFNNLDYSFTADREDGTDTNDAPGGGSPALRKQLRVLKQFMDRLDFVHMKPDVSFIVRAPGVFRRALANEGREYAAFFTVTGNGPFELIVRLPSGTYEAEWIDPLGGISLLRDDVTLADAGLARLPSPNFDGEIALRIVRSPDK